MKYSLFILYSFVICSYTYAGEHPEHPEHPTKKTPVSMPFHGEYFELLGPESSTHYGEVTWHTQPVNLPEDIIKRFDNKISVAFKNAGDEEKGKTANYNLVFNDPKERTKDGSLSI